VNNNLKLAYDKAAAKAALESAGIAPATRAETIALEEMARLYLELKGGEVQSGETTSGETKRGEKKRGEAKNGEVKK
jgi:hypothetical protein